MLPYGNAVTENKEESEQRRATWKRLRTNSQRPCLLFPQVLVQEQENGKMSPFSILFAFHYTINLHKRGMFFF